MTRQALTVLIIEDASDDAELVLRQFRQHDVAVAARRVCRTDELQAALKEQPWQIVISDYSLPQLTGWAALQIVKALQPETPFVFVSGAIGEETAIAMLKAGADDYVMKSTLTRLVPVVERVLREAAERQARQRADAALLESEASFRLLFADHPHPMWVCSAESLAFLEVNTAAVAQYGYARETFLGMRLPEIEPAASVATHLPGAGDGPKLANIEGQHRLSDGRVIEVEITTDSLRFAGRPALLMVAHDITQRKRMEDALRASEARYRGIVEDQTDLIVRFQPTGTLTFVNGAYARYHGLSPSLLVGTPFELDIAPEDRPFVVEKRAKLSPSFPAVTYWCRVKLPGGEVRWQQWTERALYDAHGRPAEHQAVGQDIHERKQAELSLKQSHAELFTLNAVSAILGRHRRKDQLAAALEALLDRMGLQGGWIQLLDPDASPLVLALVSHQALPPAAAEHLRHLGPQFGAQLSGLAVAPDEQAALLQAMLEACRTVPGWDTATGPPVLFGTPLRSETRLLGFLVAFRAAPEPLSFPQQQILTALGHQLGSAIDNLQLAEKAAEIEILREVDRLRSELIANVSHELRTPLGLITVLCTTLLREDITFDHPTQRSILVDIHEEAARLAALVDSLLNLSRLRSRQLQLEPQTLDLGRLAGELVAPGRFASQQHRIANTIAAGQFMVLADSKRLGQVLRNLLDNAVKYSPAGGDIDLGACQQERQVLVWVRDQGIGLPPKSHELIFESFYRVEHETTHGLDGVGLGLAICREIVAAHGGRIWAEGELGAGSVFYFTLPASLADGEPAGEA